MNDFVREKKINNIVDGDYRDLPDLLSSFQKGGKIALIFDDKIGKDIIENYYEALAEADFEVYKFAVTAGEICKSISEYSNMVNSLAAVNFGRKDSLVLIGGGSLGDMGGFVAASYLRGIRYIQVPSTLLAMVDSSIGAKTGINLDAGKNLLGAFYSPEFILRDMAFLKSLPEKYFWDGFAEVIKYAMLSSNIYDLIIDKSKLEKNLEAIIKSCADYKIGIVEVDCHEQNQRKLLNFGHTFAHAIERASGYKVSHGEAVAKGMAVMTRISAEENWCERKALDILMDLLCEYGYSVGIEFDADELLTYIRMDKKTDGESIDLVIPAASHRCEIKRLRIETFENIVRKYLK